jgi:hypothetical protein
LIYIRAKKERFKKGKYLYRKEGGVLSHPWSITEPKKDDYTGYSVASGIYPDIS